MLIRLVISLLSVIPWVAFAQADSFSVAVWQVVDGFNQQNNQKVNSLIDSAKGIIVLTRRGVIDQLELTKEVNFESPIPEYLPYPRGLSFSGLIKEGKLPNYNCDNDSWSKVGVYFVASNQDALLMKTVNFLKQFNEEKIEDKDYRYYEFVNNNSRRVVAVDTEGNALVFYLTKKKGRWYLTVIDRISDDCSA